MKLALQLLMMIASIAPVRAFSETIIVMSANEFNFIEHQEGKDRYVKQISNVLKKMRFKSGDFDAMKAETEDVRALLQNNSRWGAITADLQKACKTRPQKLNCANLEKIRLDTFDWIKDNPEGVIEPGDEPTAHH